MVHTKGETVWLCLGLAVFMAGLVGCNIIILNDKSLYYFESLARHLKVASFLVVLQVVRIVV